MGGLFRLPFLAVWPSTCAFRRGFFASRNINYRIQIRAWQLSDCGGSGDGPKPLRLPFGQPQGDFRPAGENPAVVKSPPCRLLPPTPSSSSRWSALSPLGIGLGAILGINDFVINRFATLQGARWRIRLHRMPKHTPPPPAPPEPDLVLTAPEPEDELLSDLNAQLRRLKEARERNDMKISRLFSLINHYEEMRARARGK
jgi:hypothetical protein